VRREFNEVRCGLGVQFEENATPVEESDIPN
jgi:hypothetical protein